MTVTLHCHPLSSFSWKVLIALYERAVPFHLQVVNPADPAQAAGLRALWGIGKFPVIEDGDTILPESSIIIEHLDRHHPGAPLIPEDGALQVRLWDRFFDLHIQGAMQPIVNDALRPEAERDPLVVARARAQLDTGYAVAEARMAGRSWAAGDGFSMADCAALPALFYAGAIHPFDGHPNLRAYLSRLRQRPSVARVVEEARPWFAWFPFAEGLPADVR